MTEIDVLKEWRDDGDSISARTSGSTGQPKEIRLDKNTVRASALRTNKFFSIDSGSLLYSCVSPDFIGGKMMAVRGELAGCRCLFETPSNRPVIATEDDVHLLAVVPSQMWHLLERNEIHPRLKNILVGGSRIAEDLEKAITASGLNAYETYGMTETASHVALRKIGEKGFKPMEGVKITLDEKQRIVIATEETGELTTNDIGEFIAEERFIIKGRADNVINTGGKKVIPEPLEEKIASMLQRNVAITWKPDNLWGQAIVLVVEGKPIDQEERMKIREILQRHEYPKAFKTMENLPKTPNGKLDRARLHEAAL